MVCKVVLDSFHYYDFVVKIDQKIMGKGSQVAFVPFLLWVEQKGLIELWKNPT